MEHHKYSLSDIENIAPFERDIYVDLLIKWLAKKEELQRKNA